LDYWEDQVEKYGTKIKHVHAAGSPRFQKAASLRSARFAAGRMTGFKMMIRNIPEAQII